MEAFPTPHRESVMTHCLGEKMLQLRGAGCYENVIEVYEYDKDRWIVGRRYTACDGQGLVNCVVCMHLDTAILNARRMSRERAD